MSIQGRIYDALVGAGTAKGRAGAKTSPPEGMNCLPDGRRYDVNGNLDPRGEFGYPIYPFATDVPGGSCSLKHIGAPTAEEVATQMAFMGNEDVPSTATLHTILQNQGTPKFFAFPQGPEGPEDAPTSPEDETIELTPREHLAAAVESETIGEALGHVAGAVSETDPATLAVVGTVLAGAVWLLGGKKKW